MAKPKLGQVLYLKKENVPMGLTVGDEYGKIKSVEELEVTIERIDGKLVSFGGWDKGSVYYKWFTTKKKK